MSSRNARWLFVDGDSGMLHELDSTSTAPPFQLALPSPAEIARVLPAPGSIQLEVPIVHDRVIGLLGAACSPADAGKAAWLSTIVHTASVHHTFVACEASSVFVGAAKRVLHERGAVRQLLLTTRPLLDWLDRCEAVVAFAPEQVAARWSLAVLVHAAHARGVPVALCAPDAAVLQSLGAQISPVSSPASSPPLPLAASDAPASIARILVPAMLTSTLSRTLPTASEPRPFAKSWEESQGMAR